MDRLRSGWSSLVLTAGAGIGGGLGFSLGVTTERGLVGIITVAATVLGIGVGIYIAQLILSARSDDDE